ncbi:hypothetical protein ACR780_15110 [Sphingobacterium faecium]|jgi:hypothetical protein|uniref:hypothetical protein n=1 Tax=Sphingobacterium faecium TaxID=34087 RepID=UPI0004E5F329|nr:exported hypothetical protein [Sphingobacterium sp. PM2-P1-29]
MMKTLIKAYAVATLITVSTFTIAAGKPIVDSPEKMILNLSAAHLAIDHYVAVMSEGQSTGVEQLFTADFSQLVHVQQPISYTDKEVVSFLKKQKGMQLNC